MKQWFESDTARLSLSLGLLIQVTALCEGAQVSPPPQRNPNPNTEQHPIDLSGSLTNPLVITPQEWKSVPQGRQTFDNIPFLIGDKFEVTGMDAARNGNFFPTHLANIPIGRKAKRIFLLHGAHDEDKDGVPIAKLVLRYANGAERSFRIAYGVHVRNWQKGRKEPKSELADPNSKLAWSRANDETDRGNVLLRLFKTAFENPLPDQEIKSVELVSLFSRATPFIAGLTLDNSGSGPLRPSELSRKAIKRANALEDAVYRQEFVVLAKSAGSGQPLTNATATLTIVDDESFLFLGESRADTEGKLRLAYPPQQTVSFTIQVKAPDHIHALISGSRSNRAEFPREVTASLQEGSSIGGLVKSRNGEPVAGAQVVVHTLTQDGPTQYTQIDYDSAYTDKDGKWVSRSVPKDLGNFRFGLSHPEFKPTIYSAGETNVRVPKIEAEALMAQNSVMTMEPGFRIEGIVTGTNKEPVANAELFVSEGSRSQTRRVVSVDGTSRTESVETTSARPTQRVLKTDAAGRFSFVALEPASVGIAVLAAGYAPKFTSVVPRPNTKLTINLSQRKTLRGRVVDNQQQPIEGVSVRLDSWQNTQLLRWRGETDQAGRFSWEGAPDDLVMLYLSKTNCYSTRGQVSPSQGEVTLSMRKMSRVSGKVIDAETRAPVEDFNVVKGRSYSPNQPIRWERYNITKGRGGEYSMRLDDSSSGEAKILIEAPGYLPAVSPSFPFGKPGWYTNNFELKKGKGIGGAVTLANGSPVPNCTVILVDDNENAYMDKPGLFRSSSSGGEYLRADLRGRFEFTPRLNASMVFAAHENGYGEIRPDELQKTGKIVLQPWGRVKGVTRVGKSVEPDQTVALQNMHYRYGEEGRQFPALGLYLKSDPDPQGNFAFEKVPPGERKVYLQYQFREGPGNIPLSHGVPVTVKPGETAEVVLGGSGRTVIGRIAVIDSEPDTVDWKRDVHTLSLNVPMQLDIRPPVITGTMTDPERQKAWAEYQEKERASWRTEKGRAADRAQRQYVLVFETNGTFRIDNVPPGPYNLNVNPTDPEQENYNYQSIGNLHKQVTIPEAPKERPDEPFDLGTLELHTKKAVKVGQMAPSLESKTLEGKTFKLQDLRGKHVLLYFSAEWGGTQTADLQALKSLHESYGKDARFALVGLSLDNDEKAAQNWAKTNQVKWTQCYLGQWSETQVPASFGITGVPGSILIGPDGRIVAKNLRGSSIRTAVQNRLPGGAAPE